MVFGGSGHQSGFHEIGGRSLPANLTISIMISLHQRMQQPVLECSLMDHPLQPMNIRSAPMSLNGWGKLLPVHSSTRKRRRLPGSIPLLLRPALRLEATLLSGNGLPQLLKSSSQQVGQLRKSDHFPILFLNRYPSNSYPNSVIRWTNTDRSTGSIRSTPKLDRYKDFIKE